MDDVRFNKVLQSIKDDRSHGASELARRCLAIMAESARGAPISDEAQFNALLDQRLAALLASRPSMAPIMNLLSRWSGEVQTNGRMAPDLTALREAAAAEAERLIEVSLSAVSITAQQAVELIGSNPTLMTHSYSSTIVELFRQLRERNVHAIVTESRPLNEGYQLAKQLSQWQIATTLITDSQMGLFVPRADAIVVGADSLLPDGSLINKSGSQLLALVAHEYGVPFYVCCESFKRWTELMGAPELESMDGAELGAPELPFVEMENIYFDITPAHLISAWIDEQGVHYQAGMTGDGWG